MNQVFLEDLEWISAMVHLMEYLENGSAHGKLDYLFDGISLGIEYVTITLMVKKLCQSWSQWYVIY